jgi:hypothetical protein
MLEKRKILDLKRLKLAQKNKFLSGDRDLGSKEGSEGSKEGSENAESDTEEEEDYGDDRYSEN